MSAAQRQRLRDANSGEAAYRAGAALKSVVCIALLGLLAVIGASALDESADRVHAMVGFAAMEAP